MATQSKRQTKKVASGDPEAANDPERTLGLDEQRRRDELEGRAEIVVTGYPTLQTHMEFMVNFTGLQPETDFEVSIKGPIAGNYWATLKSDPWGQAQLIWRTPAAGDYTVSGKGNGINVSEQFSVSSLDPDEEYRASKRNSKSKAKSAPRGNVTSVEEPAVMGDTPSGEARNQPSDEELNDPALHDPAFRTAEHDPEDQGDPTINKEPHPEGSAQFNYRVPGEPDNSSTQESKEDPDGDPKQARKEAKAATKQSRKQAEAGPDDEAQVAIRGQSGNKTQEEIDRENAHTGADEADR